MVHKTGAGIPVYQISGANTSRSLPDWLVRKRKRSLKNDPEWQNRVDLLQGFEFEEASNRIKVTNDGQYAVATGTYKPQIRVYEFDQMSLKFERHTDAENVDFVLISDDWTKSVHLQNDRTVEFHAQGGIHTRTRIPKFGRSIDYNRNNCDLYVGASSHEVYRLNIDKGQFLAPFQTEAEAVNVVRVNPAHGLVGCGTESGTVEFWDPRSRNRVGTLDVGGRGHGIGSGVTALTFRDDGLGMAAGTYEGYSLLYDLRMSEPLLKKDQGYDFPISSLGYLQTQSVTNQIWSSDKRAVKIWSTETGKPLASLEPTVDINDVAHIPNTGMFFTANEGKPMHTFYIPAVGPAPRWCSFLDSITEELEEKPVASVYENYKFVTQKELQQLGLAHLIGSNVVKSYMHGYFIDQKLYDEARLIANPFEYREHREREIRKRIEKERESRIRTTAADAAQSNVKVNRDYAPSIKEKVDDRFRAMFEDPEFQIDENSFEFKLLHGGRSGTAATGDHIIQRSAPRPLTAAEQENEGPDGSDHGSESDSDKEDGDKNSARKIRRQKQLQRQKRARQARKDSQDQSTFDRRSGAEASFGERVSAASTRGRNSSGGRISKPPAGNTEITFVPRSRKPRQRAQNGDSGRQRSRGDGTLRKASKNAFRQM